MIHLLPRGPATDLCTVQTCTYTGTATCIECTPFKLYVERNREREREGERGGESKSLNSFFYIKVTSIDDFLINLW